MHFWIDKRSPQCGFGRSRVAASLSGVGGSGVSFGHPPRRSGGSKSSSSSHSGIGVHRQQQHHHQAQHQHTQHHSQQQQTQYHQHGTAVTSAVTTAASVGAVSGTSTATLVTGVGATGATGATGTTITTNSNNPNYRSSNYASSSTSITHSNNNNNSQISGSVPSTSSIASSTTNQTPTNRNYVRPTNTTSSHHHYNNNRQQYQQQPGSQQQNNLHAPNSSSNNNHATTCNTTATTTTAVTQNVTSPTGNNLSAPYAATQTASSSAPGASTQSSHHLQQQHPYQQQRYRHPQFGNMSVRTYQPTGHHHQQQQQQQLQQTAGPNAAPNQQSLESSLNALNDTSLQSQSPNQTANIVTTELYQSSPRVVSVYPRHLSSNMATATCDHTISGTATTATLTNLPNASRTMYAGTATHTSGGGNSRRRTVTRSIESADLQFLPLHLKCGIFASLVLAIAFIVGIKVYFDNQGTKFEVGIFWLLTATFVFAFCFVSICKVPRVLFAASSASSRSGSRDQTVRDRCSMDDTRGGSVVNSIDDVVVSGLHEFQQQEQMQQQQQQLQQQQQQIGIGIQQQQQAQHPVLAGPPPYHIAILLPETKAKEEIEQLEESPPPSYDKILI